MRHEEEECPCPICTSQDSEFNRSVFSTPMTPDERRRMQTAKERTKKQEQRRKEEYEAWLQRRDEPWPIIKRKRGG
jgi:hypothetical protein